jgi:hypothetical protein
MNINLQKLQLLIPWDLGDYNIQMSKFFFWGVFSVSFFTPKLMKIKWSSLFFGSFAPHFQMKLSIHASNFNSRFVSMSELEIFLLMEVLTPNFNTMDLVKILEKNQKLHIQIIAVTLKVTSCKTISKKKKWKKVKNQDFMGKTKYFLRTLPLGSFSHMAACRSSLENTWKVSLILVFNKNSPRAHTESDLGVLGVHGKLVKYVVYSCKRKNWEKFIFLHRSCPNSNRPVFGLKEF